MAWVKDSPARQHDCRKTLPWLAPWVKPGERWRCDKPAEGGKCQRLWEVRVVLVGAAGDQKLWAEITKPTDTEPTDGPQEPGPGHVRKLTDVEVSRKVLEADLCERRLREPAPDGMTSATDELNVIRWTLDQLELCGMAVWTPK